MLFQKRSYVESKENAVRQQIKDKTAEDVVKLKPACLTVLLYTRTALQRRNHHDESEEEGGGGGEEGRIKTLVIANLSFCSEVECLGLNFIQNMQSLYCLRKVHFLNKGP